MEPNLDIGRVKRNVSKMAEMGAPESEIDGYIASEGTTVDAVRAFTASEPNAWIDAGTQFGQNFTKGIYSAANFPTALGNMASKAVGSDFRFQRPLEAMAPSLDRMAMETPEAQTPAGQYAGVVGEYAGANALPAMGMLAAAPRVAGALAGSTGLAGNVVGNTAKSIAASPGKAAAGEMLATVGAGTGAAIARDVAPDNATAEFWAALAGGIGAPAVVALSPTNLGRKAVGAVKSKLSPEAKAARAKDALSEQLRNQMTPETDKAIKQTVEIQKSVPGYKPSIAEATESPDFIATQQDFEAGLSGPALNDAANRYKRNEQSIFDASETLAPQSRLSPDEVFDGSRQRLQAIQGKLDGQESGLAGQQQRLAESTPSGSRRSTLGQTIRGELIDERGRIKEELRITANEMDLNDPTALLDFDSVKGRLEDSVQPRSQLADKSALPNGIIRDIKAMDGRASIVDMMELRSRIGSDIREAQRTPTGEKRVPYLQKLQAEVDAATDDLIARTDDPDLAGRVKEFRKMYRDQYIVPFEQGAAGAALKKDVTGAYKIPDEQVAKGFFDGWNETAAEQFKATFKNSPAANASMEAAAIDDLFNFAVRDGSLELSRVVAWGSKNKGVLASFPKISKRLATIQGTVEGIAQRQATIATRRKSVERSYLARELARLDSSLSGATPEKIIESAIDRNPRRMGRLMASLKSPEAKAAASRQVWERALNDGNPLEFIQRNKASLQLALGKDYKIAERLAMAINKNKLVKRPTGQALDTNPLASVENSLGSGLNQISSRIFAVKSGRTSARYAFADVAGRAFKNMTSNQARAMLKEIIYEPEAATALANSLQFGSMTEKQAKRLYTFMVSSGIVALSDREPLKVTVPVGRAQ